MTTTQSNFHIIGSGAVGSLLALILAQNCHGVFFTDIRENSESEKTIHLMGDLKRHFGDSKNFKYANSMRTQDNVFLFSCIKYSGNFIPSLNLVLKEFSATTPVLLLQNSYRHAQILRQSFENPFIVGMLSDLEVFYQDSVLELSSLPFTLRIADCEQTTIDTLKNATKSPILKFVSGENEKLVIWQKLARWIPLSCITTITMMNVGKALQLFPRALLNDLVNEICTFAENETGHNFDTTLILDQLNSLPRNLITSSMRDRQKKRLPEIQTVMSEIYQDLIEKNLSSIATLTTLKLLS